MVVPGYVSIEKENNKIVLRSGLDGACIELVEDRYIDDFKKLQNGNEIDNNELVSALRQNCMLLELDEFKQVSRRIRKMMKNNIMLTILPTEACNFRCVYCYEKHDDRFIDKEVMDEIIRHIEAEVLEAQIITINWFGGEPTLAANTIIEYTKKIHDIAKKNNVVFKSSMTTNGYLLTEEMFKKFYAVGIDSYQITLDGFEHDEKRVLPNGRGTLTKILTNLRAISCLPSEYKYTVILRRNLLKNEDFEWYDFLADGFAKDKRFILNIRSVANLGGEGVKRLNLIEDEEVLKEHILYASKKFGLLDDKTNAGTYSKMCYAAYPKGFVICADGTLQKCTTALYEDYNVVGKIIPGKGFVIDEKKNENWINSGLTEKCMVCENALSCNNLQCPKRILLKNDNAVCCDGLGD